MAGTLFILLLVFANATAFNNVCKHVLINSQCWLKNCPDETSMQCGSFAVNMSTFEFQNFAAVRCHLTHREIPSNFIHKKILPNTYAINSTTDCDGLCTLLNA